MQGRGPRDSRPPLPAQAAKRKKATALAAVLGWVLSLAAARGVEIDPDLLLRLDRGTLVRMLERVVITLSRPIVSGAAALMEMLSRVLLLLLALILCAAPSYRDVVLQRVRLVLRERVEVAVRCAAPAQLAGPSLAPRAWARQCCNLLT